MLYFVIYLLTALSAFALRNSPKTSGQLYPALLAALFFLTAFRFEVGCDWSGYLNQFHYDKAFEQPGASSAFNDPLWWFIIRTVRSSGLPYPWLNVVSAAIFFAGIHALARRQPDRFAFLVLLWPILIINIGMSGIRQAAAVGVLCFAYAAFVDRKLIRFGILVLLASSLHSSAMVFLLLAPLVWGEYSRPRIALAALLAIPGGILMMNSEAGELAISRYVDSGIDAAGALARVALLGLSGLFFIGVLRRRWQDTNAADFKLVQIGALAMIALAALLPLSTVIADRLAYYLVPIQAMIFARIAYLPIGRSKTLYAALPYIALGATLLIWTVFSWHFNQCYVPYRSWLFGMPESRFGIFF